jgi:hypothetical protein
LSCRTPPRRFVDAGGHAEARKGRVVIVEVSDKGAPDAWRTGTKRKRFGSLPIPTEFPLPLLALAPPPPPKSGGPEGMNQSSMSELVGPVRIVPPLGFIPGDVTPPKRLRPKPVVSMVPPPLASTSNPSGCDGFATW